MFMHNKKLQYTVRVAKPDPKLAGLMLEQFGGPQGELAAAMRYFTQALSEDDLGRRDMLFDIATEELSHLEIIGNILVMLNKGVKAKMAEGMEEGQLLSEITQGSESHTMAVLYGGAAALVNSAGVPWTAAYIDSIGDPTCDLRSNIAAESRAKIVYERLINVTDDPGIKDALTFLMTREVAHQKSFEKALYAIQGNFPPGKMPPNPEYSDVYFNMSQGDDHRGSWNEGPEWNFVAQPTPAVDGGDGMASVKLSKPESQMLQELMARTMSVPTEDPTTGAELGQRQPDAGKTKQSAGSTKAPNDRERR